MFQSTSQTCRLSVLWIIALHMCVSAAAQLTSQAPPSTVHATIHMELYGDIELELFPSAAPLTVANFIHLATSGFYNNTYFYRLHRDFVVQGGDEPNVENGTVPLEYLLPNEMWTVGLGRNYGPNSGGAQYYVNLANNSASLAPGGADPYGYCVFGRVVGGFQAVEDMLMLPVEYNATATMTEFLPPWPLITHVSIW